MCVWNSQFNSKPLANSDNSRTTEIRRILSKLNVRVLACLVDPKLVLELLLILAFQLEFTLAMRVTFSHQNAIKLKFHWARSLSHNQPWTAGSRASDQEPWPSELLKVGFFFVLHAPFNRSYLKVIWWMGPASPFPFSKAIKKEKSPYLRTFSLLEVKTP